ncbi:DNA-binding protein, partial [Sulfolobus sp. A20-N-G8]
KNYILKLEKNGLVKRLDRETCAITELGERVLNDIKSKGF